MSYADRLFIKNVKNILENGVSDEGYEVRPHWEDGTPAHTLSVFGVIDRYDLSKEFPIMTLRRTYWKSAFKEIQWIYQKKSNVISEAGSHVWDSWDIGDGTIGRAYGYQMGEGNTYTDVTLEGMKKAFPNSVVKDYPIDENYIWKCIYDTHRVMPIAFKDDDGFYMTQMDKVIYDLVNHPASRRIMTTTWNPKDMYKMALAPCAYSMTYVVEGKKLNAILNQRSQDMLAANNWNVVQYALMVYALAQAYGYEPGELIHVIANCHIYDRHIPIIKELIEQPQYDAPTFTVDKNLHDWYQASVDSFHVENYRYNDFNRKFEVAI